MLLGIVGASLLENLLLGNEVTRATEGAIETVDEMYDFIKNFVPLHRFIIIKIIRYLDYKTRFHGVYLKSYLLVVKN